MNFKSDTISSQFHDLYPKLQHNVSILLNDLSPRATSLIIKARGGLLDLNARCFKPNTDGYCTICNLNESENTLHFIGICPAYKEYRWAYFGKKVLNTYKSVLNILNGKNINSLYWYLEKCIKYRILKPNEFNI